MVNNIDSPGTVAEFERAIKAATAPKGVPHHESKKHKHEKHYSKPVVLSSQDADLNLVKLIRDRGDGISLNKMYELGQRYNKGSLKQAVESARAMQKLEGTGMNERALLQTAFYIEKILPKYIQKGQCHREITVDGLLRTIDHDPATGRTYIHVKDYDGAEMLGVGGFKKVARAIRYDRAHPELVARASGEEQYVAAEVSAMKAARGIPHVIQPESIISFTPAAHKDRKEVAIFLKLFNPGSLLKGHDSFDTIQSLSAEEKIQVARDTAQGVKGLHDKELVHRDIKPGNIFVSRDPTTKKVQAVVADLGVLTSASNAQGETAHGTPVYLPPEKYAIDPKKADIWGLGCTFYQLLYAKWPEGDFATLSKNMVLPNDSPLKKLERITWDMLGPVGSRPSIDQVIQAL